MRIVVDVLLYAESLALLLEHHAEVNVEGRVVRLEVRVVCVLDEASCILAIKSLIDIILPVVGVHFFEGEETALLVHLGGEVAVSVLDPDARHSCSLGHAGIVRTEGRRNVNDTGTVLSGHIVSEDDLECTVGLRLEPRDELVVGNACKFAALEFAVEYPERNLAVEPYREQCLRNHVNRFLAAVRIGRCDPDVVNVGADAKCCV